MLKPVLTALFVLLATIAVACAHKNADHKRADRIWSPEAAATYLDRRADAWASWPTATRGQAETKTACLCCHTTVPFAMARPLLADGLARTNAITSQIRMRVENFGQLDSPAFELMYDFNPSMKEESRGTESVLNALVLAFDDHYRGLAEPSPSTRKAFEQLWSTQTSDGSWDWLSPRFQLEPWESTSARYLGTSMALLAVGIAPGGSSVGEPIERARTYLRSSFDQQNLHNRLWALWVTLEVDALSEAQQATVVLALESRQRSDGGFSLSALGSFERETDVSDGYATALIAYILRRAGQRPEIARRATRWLEINQVASGAWNATSVNKPRDQASHIGQFMSDAATAFAVMALVENAPQRPQKPSAVRQD